MRQLFWRNIYRFLPFATLFLVEVALGATNYKSGTYLMGWDNIMPEFNFGHALTTNIFGVWQEYRGVGLPDGMGHAANLVHTLFLWLISFTLPQNTLRYAFHFLMHLTGMIGMYILLKRLFSNALLSMIGALFYGLNLITIQMFYTPLEAFSVHFAALPLLAYSLMRYLRQPSNSALFLFAIVSFLSTPQFFVPTFILPVMLLLIAISLPVIRQWKPVLIAAGIFICTNAFWVFPYFYNLPQNASIIQHAKINQMSSDEAYARNQAFGDPKSVLTMRGFMLDFEDVNQEGVPIYVMNVWRSYSQTPGAQTALYTLATLSLLGCILTLTSRKKDRKTIGISGLYLLSFALLANNTPGIATVMGTLRDRVPLIIEAYRFPFTKFSLLYAMAAGVMITYALNAIKKINIRVIASGIVLVAIFGASWPVFQGQLFYDALRMRLPHDYIELFAFMDKQDHTGRTAYLPQPDYWSWKHYRFGLVGSGFLWHGLSQPLMDRAFDPWSNVNENYYWELSSAIYSKNSIALLGVLNKYDIRYIILDENLWAPSHDRALFTEEIQQLLTTLPNTSRIGQFGTLIIYERTVPVTSFIRMTNTLPTVSPTYQWTDNDVAYRNIGDYTNALGIPTYTYPFRSLFTKRAVDERDFPIDTPSDALFSTNNSDVLTPHAVKPCGLLKHGVSEAESISDTAGTILRLINQAQRGCLSFTVPTLTHKEAYLVTIEHRHISGRPLMFSLVNNTAKHVEIETLLEKNTHEWHTDFFILPPLASDGLGYTVYLTNDSIGSNKTINDVRHIAFYPLDYDGLVTMQTTTGALNPKANSIQNKPHVLHPNPSYYRTTLSTTAAATLILSQAYNTNWSAYDITGLSPIKQLLPMVFGKKVATHVLVNNWANGWTLAPGQNEVIIFFLPQIAQYIGFGLLIVPFLIVLKRRTK